VSPGHGGPDRTFLAKLAEVDPEIARLIDAEAERQERVLDMVAAENFAPLAVLEAQGSILTNKYADGYPGRRDYDGCEVVDEIERLAIERACALFGADHANVQPYSGTSANQAVLTALAKPGDRVLGFCFEHGGHPTHHDPESVAGRFFSATCYHVREDDRLIDMDEVARLADELHPTVIFAGWSCYTRPVDFARFREIADSVGAYLVVDMAHFSGLVAGGCYPDPVPYADVCTMTVHKTLGGPRGGAIICRGALADRIDAGVYPGTQGGPLVQSIAGKATAFLLAQSPAFADRMARTVAGARTVAAILNDEVDSTKCTVVTGGTDTHEIVLDTAASGVSAQVALEWLHDVGITANAMRIAFDSQTAPAASGLRLGTTSLATRGFGVQEFRDVGEVLAAALSPGREALKVELARRTHALAAAHPAYPSR
jgi:glycine hydroxymethyltransferase